MDNIDKHIYRRDVLDFVTVATEFCRQLEQCEGSERGEFATMLQQLLPMLYLKATMVEEVEEADGFIEDIVTEDDYEYVRNQIRIILRDADDYLDVFCDNFRYSDTPILNTVSESLADCYQSLRNMVEAFRRGYDEAMEVAIFECLMDFRNNWGQQLLGAQRAIHELIASGTADEL